MKSNDAARNLPRFLPFLRVLALLAPVSLAWIVHDGAVTQDGPSHLAAAKIAAEWLAFRRDGTIGAQIASVYDFRFRPVPNWGAQALGMALVRVLPIGTAEIVLNLAGLIFPALTLTWLAESVRPAAGNDGIESTSGDSVRQRWAVSLSIAVAAINVLWTFGFTSFLLGLGSAWVWLALLRSFVQSGGLFRWAVLVIAWQLLFLCHLVAFAIGGIVGVCLIAIRSDASRQRRFGAVASMASGLPLVVQYRHLTAGNRLEPLWEHLDWADFFSVANWVRQLGWVDPLSLHAKGWHPALGHNAGAVALLPSLWASAGMAIMAIAFVKTRHGATRPSIDAAAWLSGIGFLAILGLLGPDSLGPEQGHYLPQRFCLAAVSLVPVAIRALGLRIPALGVVCLAVAWAGQSLAAIDFGRKSHTLTQTVRSSYAGIRPHDRIAALIDAAPWPYRANPRLHADALLTAAAEDVVSWNLYEAGHPYFPLRFRQMPKGLDAATLEAFSLGMRSRDAAETARMAEAILDASRDSAEIVVVLMSQGTQERDAVEAVLNARPEWRLVESRLELAIYANADLPQPQKNPRVVHDQ